MSKHINLNLLNTNIHIKSAFEELTPKKSMSKMEIYVSILMKKSGGIRHVMAIAASIEVSVSFILILIDLKMNFLSCEKIQK